MVTIPLYVAPGTPIETVIDDEILLEFIRKNSLGNLSFYVHTSMPNQTLYFSAPDNIEEIDVSESTLYIGVLDEEYSVYVGTHNSVIFHILLEKEITPDTHDVTIRAVVDSGIFKGTDRLFYTVVPVVAHKKLLIW